MCRRCPVTKWKRGVWAVGLAVYVGGLGSIKADDGADARLEAEAKLLFRAVLADEPAPEPCELTAKWDTYPIPESVVREYLDASLRGDLSAPSVETQPRAILDFGDRGALCSAETTKALLSERRKEFEAGVDKMLVIKSTRYTFPAFSDDHRTAVLVVSHSAEGWVRMPDGIKRLPVQAVGYAAVYAKSDNGWSRVTTIELFIT